MNNVRPEETRSYVMRARAESARRTGERILEAAHRKFSATHFVDVTVAEVAEAAGCSEQTVYRRFGSKEGLFRAVADRVGEDIVGGRSRVPSGDVAAAVERVLADYEQSGDQMILLQRQEDRVETIADVVDRGRRLHHEWVATVFGAELDRCAPEERTRLHGQLVVALDVQTWKRLRRDLELDRVETGRAMEEMCRAILAAHHASPPTGEEER